LKIGKRIISDAHSPFIIGEIGINHNGSLKIAVKLIDLAKKAGFEAIKFQTYKTELLVKEKTALAKYQKEKFKNNNMFNMLKKYELSFNDFHFLKKYCDRKNIIFLSTPFDEESAIFLNSLNIKAFKISSGDFDNLLLLEKIKKFNKPIILSTGMSSDTEIKSVLKYFKNYKNKLAVLHCISDYPTALIDTQLYQIKKLKLLNSCVGFSDHTQGFVASSIAVHLGANIIEKHITLDNKLSGPDHASSLNQKDFKTFVNSLVDVKKIFSYKKRFLTKSEIENKKLVRKSLFFNNDFKKGEIIDKSMLHALRPKQNGISPFKYKNFLKKKLIFNVKKNEQVKKKYTN
jgi:N,N'-diacetyllegionaminate synthase